MWKAITILFLVGASTVFAIDNAEQLSIVSVIPMQISPCPAFGAPRQQSECIDIELATAARDLFAPPTGFAQSPDRLPAGVTALPTVPATFFMVLCGFLCVVFVKDRKVWLVALAGLLWAGQAGINAIPKLVFRLAERSSRSLPAQSSLTLYHGNFSGLPSYNEGTRYIGLLRHLAGIPVSNFKYDKAEKLFDAFISSQISDSLFVCLIKRTERIIYFSPAFIFDNLARGPPAKS